MGAAVHVGVVVVVVVLKGLEHLARLLAGGGVVEVDQRLAQAGGLCQQGEIRASECGQVVGLRHRRSRRSGEGGGHA